MCADLIPSKHAAVCRTAYGARCLGPDGGPQELRDTPEAWSWDSADRAVFEGVALRLAVALSPREDRVQKRGGVTSSSVRGYST